jgi:hypothetical protein
MMTIVDYNGRQPDNSQCDTAPAVPSRDGCPLKSLKEQIMKNLNVSQPLAGLIPAFRFEAAKASASSLASSDPELIEPELVDRHDRATQMSSPVSCLVAAVQHETSIEGDHHVGYQSHH